MDFNIKTTKLIGLSKFDEEEILKQTKRNALKNCDPLVNEYIECARSTYMVTKCKPLVARMNDCVRQYTTQEDVDRVRTQYHHDKQRRQRQQTNQK